MLIIGGGLCGVLCAYRLQEAGVRYALIEAGRICRGVTAQTTAKITSQHGLFYHDLLRRLGPARARQYYDVSEAALARYRALCRTMDCGFEDRDAYVYETGGTKKLEAEKAALDRLGIPADGLSRLPLMVVDCGLSEGELRALRAAEAESSELRVFTPREWEEYRETEREARVFGA